MSYDAANIQVLEGLEAVRVRPGMYIGSTSERGLHHLVWEIVDNSVDEAMAGYASDIIVTMLPNDGIRVADNGRGIPTDIHPVEGKPALEVVLTVLHAGGKFGGEGYKISGGLHGVGSSVVNALSTKLEAKVKRNGKIHYIEFANGGKPQGEMQILGDCGDETGTEITFYADPTIFDTTSYSWETLATRFREMCFLNKGLGITLIDEREKIQDEAGFGNGEGYYRTESWRYEGGLIDFVSYLNASRTPVHENPVYLEANNGETSVEIAMQWTTSYSQNVHSFVNTINTIEGGTHEEGFRTALTAVVNKYAREKGFLKEKDDNFSGDDVREGMTAVISAKVSNPQFEGQTKTKLGNAEVRTYTHKVVYETVSDWLDRNPNEAKAIIEKITSAAHARLAARKARDMVRKKTVLSGSSMPDKLADCSSKVAAESELFLVEGDSAGGSAKTGRDPKTQAILSLRGKVLNVEKARLDQALKNKEIDAIITAMGCGVGETFDITKLRYHKIVFLSDADVDGAHIQTLLLTLFYRFMRPVIEQGYVYLPTPPLYRLRFDRKGDDVVYVYSDEERDRVIAEAVANGKKDPRNMEGGVQRFKGLGEMNADELWDTTMNPKNRVLKRIMVDDAAKADEMFSILMGDVVEPRRDYISEHAKTVDVESMM